MLRQSTPIRRRKPTLNGPTETRPTRSPRLPELVPGRHQHLRVAVSIVERTWRKARTPVASIDYALSLREQSRLSLRRAADGIGISHPFLAKIERGQVVRPESLELLERMALTYDVRLPERFERAGVRYAVADPSDAPIRNAVRDRLRRLLSHEHFRPEDFDDSELPHISDRVAELMLSLAQNAWTRGAVRSEPSLYDVLAGTVEAEE